METLTALVIQEKERDRKLMVALLTSQAIQVHAFATPEHYRQSMGEQCFNCCEHSQSCCYDLILTENRLPGMSGLDFLDRLEKAGCELPPEHKAIFSKDWSPEEKDQAIERNYQVFTKPFALSDILDWIDEVSQ